MSQQIRKSDIPDKKKTEIVKHPADGTMKVAEVARECGLPHTTVSTWKKQADKITQDAGKEKEVKAVPTYWSWTEFDSMALRNALTGCPLPITYMMLCLKAEL